MNVTRTLWQNSKTEKCVINQLLQKINAQQKLDWNNCFNLSLGFQKENGWLISGQFHQLTLPWLFSTNMLIHFKKFRSTLQNQIFKIIYEKKRQKINYGVEQHFGISLRWKYNRFHILVQLWINNYYIHFPRDHVI